MATLALRCFLVHRQREKYFPLKLQLFVPQSHVHSGFPNCEQKRLRLVNVEIKFHTPSVSSVPLVLQLFCEKMQITNFFECIEDTSWRYRTCRRAMETALQFVSFSNKRWLKIEVTPRQESAFLRCPSTLSFLSESWGRVEGGGELGTRPVISAPVSESEKTLPPVKKSQAEESFAPCGVQGGKAARSAEQPTLPTISRRTGRRPAPLGPVVHGSPWIGSPSRYARAVLTARRPITHRIHPIFQAVERNWTNARLTSQPSGWVLPETRSLHAKRVSSGFATFTLHLCQ